MAGRALEDATLATEEIAAGRGQRVLLVIGGGSVSAHPLPERGTLVLGRSRGADVVIDDRSVSRHHARLWLDGPRIAIEDLGSANGTRIGRRIVTGPVALAAGEPFHLGPVTLVIDDATDATGRTPAPSAPAIDSTPGQSSGPGDFDSESEIETGPDRDSLREAARREVEAVERRRILAALDQAGGNQTRAAAILGISRRTLVHRLDAYDFPRPRKAR